MTSRLRFSSFGLASLIAVGTSACSNPTQNNNVLPVVADTLTVFALTGTPPSFPAAFLASSGAVTRADGSFNFDIAFDITASNKVIIYPQKLVGIPCVVGALNCGGSAGSKAVGLQRTTVVFDSLLRHEIPLPLVAGVGGPEDNTFLACNSQKSG